MVPNPVTTFDRYRALPQGGPLFFLAARAVRRAAAILLEAGLVSEGLMVLATRQHVTAWEGEVNAVYRSAAWYLYAEVWRWTEARNPELSPLDRCQLLDRLLTPVQDAAEPGSRKALLLGYLFRGLLLGRLAGD